jgi:hypothetical protein
MGRKVGWIVKLYGKFGRKASWNVKRGVRTIWKKYKLNSEKDMEYMVEKYVE